MSNQVIAKFVRTHMRDVLNGSSEGVDSPNKEKKAKNSEAIKDGSSTISVGQIARFDTTPVTPAGDEYTGYDPRVAGPDFSKPGTDSPIIEWELLKDDGSDLMALGDANPFSIRAYGKAHNNGCTIGLKLQEQLGAGRQRLRFGPKVNADPSWNGGVGVKADNYAILWAD